MNIEIINKLIVVIINSFGEKNYKKLSAIGLYLDVKLFERLEHKSLLYNLFKIIDTNPNINILRDNVDIEDYKDLEFLK